MLKRLILLGMTLGTVAAVPLSAQKPDSQIAPLSVSLQKEGEALLGAGSFIAAQDALETALAVDPRNREAFVDLSRVAIRQKLFGKAIRFSNKALALEPNDRDALAVQGVAMVEAGASARAQQNLAKLQNLCVKGCPQLSELGAAITRGPSPTTPKPAPKK